MGGGGRTLLLRDGWDAVSQFSGRDGRQTVATSGERSTSTQGGVGSWYTGNCYWFMECSLNHTNYFERLFDWLFVCQNFALGRNVSLIFCHANAKLAFKHWTIIVIENITNSIPVFDPPLRYKICVVPVRSTCASAKWYRRVSMNHLSVTSRFPLVCDKKSKGKRDVFIIVSQHGVQLIQLSMKLSWHIQATDNKIFRAESVTFTDFYVLPTENIGKQQ